MGNVLAGSAVSDADAAKTGGKTCLGQCNRPGAKLGEHSAAFAGAWLYACAGYGSSVPGRAGCRRDGASGQAAAAV